MKTVRTVLNELKWRTDRDFTKVEVEYIHRGGPGDLATVEGGDIASLEAWMMVIRRREAPEQLPGRRVITAVPGEAAIPYHRVTRVLYDGKVVFDRKAGRDLLDEPETPSPPLARGAPEEDGGIYPEPPAVSGKEPHLVDAHDDAVPAAGTRDDEQPPKRPAPKRPKTGNVKKGGKARKKPTAGKKGQGK